MIFILMLGLFASLSVAQNFDAYEACEASCCEQSGGTWENGYCENAGPDYYSCVDSCVSMSDFYFGEGMDSSCCCGTAFILLLLGGAVVAKQR